jgi:dTDP-4-dehydrorhamnose 3,5-epimerase
VIILETPLKGAFTIDLERRSDERGFFARTFCRKEFDAAGLNTQLVQCNLSYNYLRGTLRGMHFQTPPAAEVKVVRCTRGVICDVIVDLRPESPTYLSHYAVELSSDNGRALYVPEMFAHGYQALTEGAEVAYQVTEYYTPGCERGIRYDDAMLAISWPLPVTSISEKDATWPPFIAAAAGRMGK